MASLGVGMTHPRLLNPLELLTFLRRGEVMKLFGRTFTRREIEARVSRIDALGGVRRFTLTEGPDAGVEMIALRTGAGLACMLNASRCLDVGLTEFRGVPISWQSPAGEVHPAYFDPRGLEWLRTAVGGLLMTCGLTHAGAPCEDAGESLGLHGRMHHTPARQVSAEGRWDGDEYDLRVAGVVDEMRLFGETLRLTREITARLGENRLRIRDRVENVGFRATPHMMLYHFNFGYPLMDEATTVSFPSTHVVPREKDLPMEGIDTWQAPEAGYAERVYYHEGLRTDADGRACVTITNPEFPLAGGGEKTALAVDLAWSTDTLPVCTEWKMPAAGVYVLGVEPANCHVEGRAAERRRGTLVTLEPGESVSYDLELRVTAGVTS